MSDPGIGAAGYVGVALETVPGEYTAPTKFFPIRSEGMQWQNNPILRRVIRGTADPIGAVPGDGHVEGDIDSEALEDVIPYFLRCARGDLTQTGAEAPYTYEFVPNHKAVPDNTMSLVVVRNEIVFGYTGLVVSSFNFSLDEGMLVVTWSLIGREESEQTDPGPPAYGDDEPFGAGSYELYIPASAQDPVEDTDNFSFQVDDGGEPQNRLINRRGAAFVSYGERSTQLTMERDFLSRDDYNKFKALTEEGINLRSEKDADHYVELEVPASIQETHEIPLSGVGDLVRSSITYQGIHDATIGAAYKITLGTDEDLGLVV